MNAAAARRGHSLVELMTVLAIAALLLALAVPGLQAIIAQQRLRAAQNDLFAAIHLTRSQAIARGSRVMLMPQDAAATDWAQGWVVFIDSNGNLRQDMEEERIFQQGPLNPGISIKFAFSPGPARQYIAYNGEGRSCSATSSQAAHWGTLSLFHKSAIRRIKINMLGRVRACDPALPGRSCTGAADAQ